jgi:serine/threonine protein kinase
MAQIVLIMQDFHSYGICLGTHLAPEGFLIDQEKELVKFEAWIEALLLKDTKSDRETPVDVTYTAPEVISKTNVKEIRAKDFWSLGIFLFEVLTGLVTFKKSCFSQ